MTQDRKSLIGNIAAELEAEIGGINYIDWSVIAEKIVNLLEELKVLNIKEEK